MISSVYIRVCIVDFCKIKMYKLTLSFLTSRMRHNGTKSLLKPVETRNVSLGLGCPYFFTFAGGTDGQRHIKSPT